MRSLCCLALNSDVSDKAGDCNLDTEVFSLYCYVVLALCLGKSCNKGW